MPRKTRSIEPGSVYHFISRFVAKEWFIEGDRDRALYMRLFNRAIMESDWRSIGYAIMNSHVHHALIAGRDRLKEWLGEVHGPFAEVMNRRHDRIGAVFARGPKAIGMRNDGAAPLVAYIHRNPVRAGVVDRASDSTWTSHRAYLQPETAPPWLDVTRGMELMRFKNPQEMDAWVDATPVERAELDTYRIEPLKPPGRPSDRSLALMAEKAKPAGAAAGFCW